MKLYFRPPYGNPSNKKPKNAERSENPLAPLVQAAQKIMHTKTPTTKDYSPPYPEDGLRSRVPPEQFVLARIIIAEVTGLLGITPAHNNEHGPFPLVLDIPDSEWKDEFEVRLKNAGYNVSLHRDDGKKNGGENQIARTASAVQ